MLDLEHLPAVRQATRPVLQGDEKPVVVWQDAVPKGVKEWDRLEVEFDGTRLIRAKMDSEEKLRMKKRIEIPRHSEARAVETFGQRGVGVRRPRHSETPTQRETEVVDKVQFSSIINSGYATISLFAEQRLLFSRKKWQVMTQAKIAQAAPKVLVICKDPDTGPAWAYCLKQKQMQVILETSPTNARQRMTDQAPDLLVIDVAILSTSVFTSTKSLIKDLRGETANPILLLASRQDEEYILEMYNVGVDEYIVKPISPAIFVAKTRAWLRHSWTMPVALLNKIQVGKMSLLPEERMLATQDRGSKKLTNLELRLLHVLMSDVGKTISAEELINRTWGYSEETDNTLLKNMIYRLRRKVEIDPADPHIILTVPGTGYKFVAD